MRSKANQELPLDAIAWYAWEPDEVESNWLLTYVDMLSVLLAMLVVLLGHMAAQRTQMPVVHIAQAVQVVKAVVDGRVEKPETVPSQSTAPAATVEKSERMPAQPTVPEETVEKSESVPEQPTVPEETVEKSESVPEQPTVPEAAVEKPEMLPQQPTTLAAAVEQSDVAPEQPAAAETTIAPATVATPESRLAKAIETQFQGEIKVVQRDHGVSLEIAEVILFDSGKADLLPEAGLVLARLAATLQQIGDTAIAVEGHTDDRPIRGGRFRSNWELAAARANAVTQFLLSQGFAPERLRSVSYADTRPVADNTTAAGRAENRRVNLRVDFL
jgi:chemotaxis protein MotB